MRTYDITLTISPDLVVWPEDPPIDIHRVSKIEDGEISNVTRVNMSAHTGTHVDAPYHFIEDGDTVENLDVDMLMGRAYVLHIPDDVDIITAEMIESSTIPPRTKRVLFRTRNSNIWANGGSADFDTNYAALSPEACDVLIRRGVKLVGVDYLSVAPFTDLVSTHEVLLSAGTIIVEGLNLSEVSQGRYTLYCLPIKLGGADGAPARAILVGV